MKVLDNLANNVNALAKSANPWISTDELTPGTYKTLNLIELPEIMQRTGRPIGAALMRTWFKRPAFTIPENWKAGRADYKNVPDTALSTDIIKMQWALNFARTQKAYSDLKGIFNGQNTESLAKTKERLYGHLKKANKFLSGPTFFGDGNLSVIQVHESLDVNYRLVGSEFTAQVTDPTDDLYCALGAFSVHLALAGSIKPLANAGRTTHEIRIEKMGFYVRDTYDFIGHQLLGFWSHDGVSKTPSSGYSVVDNGSFRDWRARHRMGGDFVVFSDVKWEHLPVPILWKYPL